MLLKKDSSKHPRGKPGRDHVSGLDDTMAATSEAQRAGRADGARVPGSASATSNAGLDGTLTATHTAELRESRTPAQLDTVARDRYAVDCEIARGGMGRIMRAHDRRHGRVVAIKESLRPEPELIARFTREALITARLQHPAIVPVYEAGQWESGDPFYAMKLVDGRPVSTEIQKCKTLVQRMAFLPNLLAVTEALAYAHTHGIIHRDLKPSNIIIGKFGETVVIDWGLAKDLHNDIGDPLALPEPPADSTDRSLTSSPSLTAVGHVIGTPAYMAPEQALGEMVDQRADVYSLGAIAYHLLAGKAPYHGHNSAQVLDDVIDHPPTPLRQRVHGVPGDLATIVERAMARDPEARYPSANELVDDLRQFLAGQMVRTHDYSPVELVRRFLSRHRGAVAVAVIMILAMAGLGVVAVDKIVEERNNARAERARAEQLRAVAMSRRSEAEDVIAKVLENLDQRGQTMGRADLLTDVAAGVMEYYDDDESADERDIERRLSVLRVLAKAYQRKGDMDTALHAYRKSLAETNKMVDKRPEANEWMLLLADHHRQIGEILTTQGKTDDAAAEYQRGIALAKSLVDAGENDPKASAQLTDMYAQLGLSLLLESDVNGSKRAYRNSSQHARAAKRAGVSLGQPALTATIDENGDLYVPAIAGMEVDVTIPARFLSALPDSVNAVVKRVAAPESSANVLIEMTDEAPEMGILHSLDRFEEAAGHTEHTSLLFEKVATALVDNERALDDSASRLARAKVYLNLARSLAPRNQPAAQKYADQCVDLLDAPPDDAAMPAVWRQQLREARKTQRDLSTLH